MEAAIGLDDRGKCFGRLTSIVEWSSYFAESLKAKQSLGQLRNRGGPAFYLEDSPGQRSGPTADASSILLDFGSNDYLGLSRHPAVLAALSACTQSGSRASPVLCGYYSAHRRLEAALAGLTRSEDALVFSSGYAANTGVIACLAGERDLILSDQLNHACLIDGCRLSRAHTQVYPHNCGVFVRDFLEANRSRFERVLIVTESVFSMDGDLADLKVLADLADQYDGGLVVDEAHATGVYGPRGSGLIGELGLQGRCLAKLGTLSKALGNVGGYVCGSQLLIDYLINHCRSYIFSTAAAMSVMCAAEAALSEMEKMDVVRRQLRERSTYLRKVLQQQGWHVPVAGQDEQPADSPIIPVVVGAEALAVKLSKHLLKQGIYVPAIRPPTVPEGTSRLRISLSVEHDQDAVDRLANAMGQAFGHTPSSQMAPASKS